MDVSLTGNMVLICLIGLILLTIGIIFVLRNMFGNKSAEYFQEKYGDAKDTIATRTKYPEANVFKHSGTLFRFGLVGALALTVMAFSWTQYEQTIDVSMYDLEVEEELEIEPPRTAEPPPPPPPPPPPVIEEVPEEEILEEDEPIFEDQSIEEETVMEELPPPVEEEAPPPPPPPPPPPEPEVEEIFKVVEEMPRFPGCDTGTSAEKKACADQKLLQYLYKNLKYPAIARENGVEGRVYIQFVVEKDGSVQDAKIVRDIGAGCGQAALKVVNDMNNLPQKWSPGKQRGKAVRVLYTLPVTFKLEG